MSVALNTAIKALATAQLGIETAGHNIANLNTPGYSRQRALLETTAPFNARGGFQVGTGVSVAGIHSIVDSGLEAQLRAQRSLTGRAEVDLSRWSALEGVFNEPDGGLSVQLSGLYDSLATLQADPAERALRGGAVQAFSSFATDLNLLASRVESITSDALDEVDALANEANDLTGRIVDLNRQVLSSEANGSRANDLRDRREELTKNLAELIDLRAIERPSGEVAIVAGGTTLVNGSTATQLRAVRETDGSTSLISTQTGRPLTLHSGKVAALLDHEAQGGGRILSELDRLAYGMALHFNRLHSTGVPLSGSFDLLTSHNLVRDADGDGEVGDELIGQAGLPFDVQSGELYVTVTHQSTGELERTRIDIDPGSTTLNGLAAELSNISNLTASVDPTGRLRIRAGSGYGFDFGNRLDGTPDAFGSFGGARPAIATANAEPFDLSTALAGGTADFNVVIDGTNHAIALASSDFADPSAATAAELAAAINSDLGTAGTATDVGGRLSVRSNTAGSTASLALADGTGSPLAALGLPTGTTRNGQTLNAEPQITGSYTGSTNGQLVFIPDGDGQIGVTDGLTLGVFDTNGNRLTTLDVGRDYTEGDPLTVVDGIEVSFSSAQVSASANDVFKVDTLADSDTSDVLVALGVNSLFVGTTANDLAINPDLDRNPDLLATGLSGEAGDPDNIVRMLDLREEEFGEFGDQAIEVFYGNLVGDLAFSTASARTTLDAEQEISQRIQEQRDSVSGVNIDEEMLDIVRFEQTYQAVTRFIDAVNRITDTLLQIAS
ncbi:MAG: flagellar hook-associated protein FlgK [Planctomycetota bacterium]